jgi:chromosomal replication initiation ATPase DnaA
MSLAYEDNTGMTVGAAFNRHYTAVVYAAKRVDSLCEVHAELAEEREALKCRLMN